MNLLRDHPDLTGSFVKTEEYLENMSNIEQVDESISEATKRMKNFEWDLLQAECRLEKEKAATDKVAKDMEEFLNEISSFEGDAWDYIRDVIKKWIHYLQLHEVETELGDERIELVSKPVNVKRKYKALVRNRAKNKLAFIEKNIEAAKLTKLKMNFRLPKLSKEDKLQLEDLVKKSKNFALNEYKLQKSELDKLKEINSKLSLHRLDSGTSVILNTLKNDEVNLNKMTKKSQKFVLNEYNLQKSELEKLKDINFKLLQHKRDKEGTNLNKVDTQLEELCQQFALQEYNLPKFDYEKLTDIKSKRLLH